eukprot:11193832-Lingulodinium_polyedra.AAC.1
MASCSCVLGLHCLTVGRRRHHCYSVMLRAALPQAQKAMLLCDFGSRFWHDHVDRIFESIWNPARVPPAAAYAAFSQANGIWYFGKAQSSRKHGPDVAAGWVA